MSGSAHPPIPYGGDRRRWDLACQQIQQPYSATGPGPGGRRSTLTSVGSDLSRRPVECTAWGWIRWDWPASAADPFAAAFAQQVGVLVPPPAAPVGRLLARAAIPRTGLRLETLGGFELPAPVSVRRLALFFAVLFACSASVARYVPSDWFLAAAAGPALAAAWLVPAVVEAWGRRHARVVDCWMPHAERLHAILGAQQAVTADSQADPAPELRQAVALHHRFAWDAAGLVLAAPSGAVAPSSLAVYEAAYEDLAAAAGRTLRARSSLEQQILATGDESEPPRRRAHRGRGRARPVADAAPAELLADLAVGLRDLTRGLEYAQAVLTDRPHTADSVVTARPEESA